MSRSTTTYRRRKSAIAFRELRNEFDSRDSAQLPSDLASSIDKATEIAGGRVIDETKKQYKAVFKFITKYFTENETKYPEAFGEDGNLLIPIRDEYLKAFFGDMTAERPANDFKDSRKRNSHKSKASIQKYISSIKYEYDEHNVLMSSTLTTFLEDFSAGYKRKVAKLKEEGKMSNHEGKEEV